MSAEQLMVGAMAAGEEVVMSVLGARAVEITKLLEATFPPKPLGEVEAAFARQGVAANEKVASLAPAAPSHRAYHTQRADTRANVLGPTHRVQ